MLPIVAVSRYWQSPLPRQALLLAVRVGYMHYTSEELVIVDLLPYRRQ